MRRDQIVYLTTSSEPEIRHGKLVNSLDLVATLVQLNQASLLIEKRVTICLYFKSLRLSILSPEGKVIKKDKPKVLFSSILGHETNPEVSGEELLEEVLVRLSVLEFLDKLHLLPVLHYLTHLHLLLAVQEQTLRAHLLHIREG